jgi:hypothetical protein
MYAVLLLCMLVVSYLKYVSSKEYVPQFHIFDEQASL